MRIHSLLGAASFTLIVCGSVLGAARSPAAPLRTTAVDGTWHQLTAPNGTLPVLDPVRRRLVLLAGQSGVFTLSLDAPYGWSKLVVSGSGPTGEIGPAIYDPVRDRYILYVGAAYPGAISAVWALSLSGTPSWTQLPTGATAPFARAGAAAIYDPVRDRMILFGGEISTFEGIYEANDAWALSLSGSPTWTQLASGPPGRDDASAVYDALRDRMLIFSGASDVARSDVWSLDLAANAWTQLFPAGALPEPRYGHAAIYDPVRDRMVIAGGFFLGASIHSVWALSLSDTLAWTSLSPAEPTSPPAPANERLRGAYDPVTDAMMAYDGSLVWKLSLAAPPAWSLVNPPSAPPPSPRSGDNLVYDSLRHRWLVFGGIGGPRGNLPLQDTWALDVSAGTPRWERIDASGPLPPPRVDYAAIYDAPRDRLLIFGGATPQNFGQTYLNDVWALSLSGVPAWTQLTPAGAGPTGVQAPQAVYDPVGDQVVIWGGFYTDGPLFDTQGWSLALGGGGQWSRITSTGPPGRFYHSAIYDASRRRMIVFGGQLFGGTRFNDAWALSLAPGGGWTQIGGAGGPSPRYGAALGYDRRHDRMWVVGGTGGTWAQPWGLDLGTGAWSPLNVDGNPPTSGPPGAFDPDRDEMVFYGPTGVVATLTTANDTPTPVLISLVNRRSQPGEVSLTWQVENDASDVTFERRTAATGWAITGQHALPDSRGFVVLEDRAVIAGMRYGYRVIVHARAGQFTGGETWIVVPAELALALHTPDPNPSEGALAIRLSLPRDGPARLELLDVGGRSVVVRDLGGLGAGDHLVELTDTRSLVPGLYWLRLSQDGVTRTAKAVVSR